MKIGGIITLFYYSSCSLADVENEPIVYHVTLIYIMTIVQPFLFLLANMEKKTNSFYDCIVTGNPVINLSLSILKSLVISVF